MRKLLCFDVMIASSTNNKYKLYIFTQGEIKTDEKINQQNKKIDCIFLSTPSYCQDINVKGDQNSRISNIPSLSIPIASSSFNSIIKLLSFAYKSKPISKSLCLALNPLLINRDGGLYDNLPWNTWSIDPLKRNRDSAGNVIDKKMHMGKRDAYNRFMGRDWYGRSLSIGNLAARVKYTFDNNDGDARSMSRFTINEKEGAKDRATFDENAATVLAKRVLQVEFTEARMAKAEAEEALAIHRAELSSFDKKMVSDEVLIDNYDLIQNSLRTVENTDSDMQTIMDVLDSLKDPPIQFVPSFDGNYTVGNTITQTQNFLTKFTDAIIKEFETDAPYRGAMDYKPTIDTKEEMFEKSRLPYTSPFELMNEIINEQLNADVIGCVLENTSLFSGRLVLGGSVILMRRGRKKTATIENEEVEIDDPYDNFGNDGIFSGEVFVCECECDEAIGMSLAAGIDLKIEGSIWERAQSVTSLIRDFTAPRKNTVSASNLDVNIMDILPKLDCDDFFVVKVQGEGSPSNGTSKQVPKTVSSFIDLFTFTEQSLSTSVDNPIKSLNQYDELTIEDKASMLLSLESFKDKLPRPRSLLEDETQILATVGKVKDSSILLNQLDKTLIPFIDESVRNQILLRDAENRNDKETANYLRLKKSKLQLANEKSSQARTDGRDDVVALWNEEASLYTDLRADVTQDEGSYDRYLDKDEWYERERLARVKRTKKSKFGTLLDGLE